MRQAILALFVASMIVGVMPFVMAGESAMGKGAPDSYFPVALKNQWVYVTVKADDRVQTETVQVVGSDLVNGKVVFLTSNYSFGFVAEPIEFVTDELGRTCEHRDGKFAVWYPWLEKEPVFLPDFGVMDCFHGASGIMYHIDEVKVPAGTFNDVFRVTYDQNPCADAGPVSETFARGIGLVERQVMTFTGIQTWQLLSVTVQPGVRSDDGVLPLSTATWGQIKATFTE
jgi:hypothetical protein